MVEKRNYSKIIAYILIALIAIAIIFLIEKIFTKNSDSIIEEKKEPTINIAEIVSNIKKEKGEPLYESKNIEGIISLVYEEESIYKDNNYYNSILIDTKTGKKLTFLDTINNLDEFKQEEARLLSLKYPKFIVDGIINTSGKRYFYVKDESVTITYVDFELIEPITEKITLTINYNEIKNLLKFKPVLTSDYENKEIFTYDKNKKTVAITFDDGPSRANNARILEILNDNKAHATFFMVGEWMYNNRDLILNTYKSGNEIGSHTYEHMNIKTKDPLVVEESLKKTDNIFYEVTKDHIKLLRPPYGEYSRFNLNNINNSFILWNLDTEDWLYKDPDRIVNYIMENVSDGSIILMHELYSTSVEALNIVLPKLYSAGYQVVSVSKLAELKGINLNNHQAYYSIK